MVDTNFRASMKFMYFSSIVLMLIFVTFWKCYTHGHIEEMKEGFKLASVAFAALATFVTCRIVKPSPKPTAIFDEGVVATLRTGDVLLTPCKGYYSAVVRSFNGGDWAHCALVHRYGSSPWDVEIFEINYYEDDLEDEDGHPKILKNVIRMCIRKWISLNEYQRKTAIARIRNPPENEVEIERALSDAMDDSKHSKINLELFTLLRIFGPSSHRGEEDVRFPKYTFCSELVAILLQRCGIIPRNRRPCKFDLFFEKLPEYHDTMTTYRIPDMPIGDAPCDRVDAPHHYCQAPETAPASESVDEIKNDKERRNVRFCDDDCRDNNSGTGVRNVLSETEIREKPEPFSECESARDAILSQI